MFNWHRKLETSHAHPRPAIVLPDDPIYPGLKRVSIQGDYATEKRMDWPTTWHYNQDGTIDGDQTGEWRLVAA